MRDSIGEIKIYEILTDAGLPFEEEYEFASLTIAAISTSL